MIALPLISRQIPACSRATDCTAVSNACRFCQITASWNIGSRAKSRNVSVWPVKELREALDPLGIEALAFLLGFSNFFEYSLDLWRKILRARYLAFCQAAAAR